MNHFEKIAAGVLLGWSILLVVHLTKDAVPGLMGFCIGALTTGTIVVVDAVSTRRERNR